MKCKNLAKVSFIGLMLLIESGCSHPESFLHRGNVAFRQRDMSRARGYYLEAAGHDRTRLVANYNLARVAYEEGRHEEVLALLDRTDSLKNTQPFIFYYRGLCLSALGRQGEAEDVFRSCNKVHPDFPEAWMELARISADKKDFERALDSARMALRHPSFIEEATLLIVDVLRVQEKHTEVVRELEGLVVTHPYRIQTHFSLASSLLQIRDFRGAERRFRKVLSMEASSVESVLGLSASLEGQLRFTEAEALLEQVERNSPPQSPFLGRVRESRRRIKERAVDEF